MISVYQVTTHQAGISTTHKVAASNALKAASTTLKSLVRAGNNEPINITVS